MEGLIFGVLRYAKIQIRIFNSKTETVKPVLSGRHPLGMA